MSTENQSDSKTIRILAFADIVGKAGRKCIARFITDNKEELAPDVILLNGENAAGGFGITEKIFNGFINDLGVDCVTMGNHWQSKKDIFKFHKREPRIILPANAWNVSDIESGFTVLGLKHNPDIKFAVVNLLGKAFMYGDNLCPFKTIESVDRQIPSYIKIRILDYHGETSSEKQAMGHYLSGRYSLIYGSHTHVPTADERIIDNHTGFLTDIGMSGAYDSVIGMNKQGAINWLLTGEKKKFEPAESDPWVCGVLAEVDAISGQCISIKRIQKRGL